MKKSKEEKYPIEFKKGFSPEDARLAELIFPTEDVSKELDIILKKNGCNPKVWETDKKKKKEKLMLEYFSKREKTTSPEEKALRKNAHGEALANERLEGVTMNAVPGAIMYEMAILYENGQMTSEEQGLVLDKLYGKNTTGYNGYFRL